MNNRIIVLIGVLVFALTLAVIVGLQISGQIAGVVFGMAVGLVIGAVIGSLTTLAAARQAAPPPASGSPPRHQAPQAGFADYDPVDPTATIHLTQDQAEALLLVLHRQQTAPSAFPLTPTGRTRNFSAVGGAELPDDEDEY
ncbi:MAG: hypothetical protein GYB68_15755 [Chloroflexi bacterium]|nr:hypothetical protein [Chloroflexota bacterium]